MAKKTATAHKRGWQQWTEREGRAALDELARSGVSLSRFAKTTGVSTTRLAYWKGRLGPVTEPAFVQVELPRRDSVSTGRHFEVVAGRVVVRVREDIDLDQLARIVEALDRVIAPC